MGNYQKKRKAAEEHNRRYVAAKQERKSRAGWHTTRGRKTMKYLIVALTLVLASLAFTAPASACYVWEARDGGACSKHK